MVGIEQRDQLQKEMLEKRVNFFPLRLDLYDSSNFKFSVEKLLREGAHHHFGNLHA